MKRFFFLLPVLFVHLSAFSQTFSIISYGAVSDGGKNNAAAIQKTIDACYQNGGGMVYVPAGTFVTGTIHLKSHVNLYLESGAVLKGSPTLSDYDTYTLPGYGLNYYGLLYTTGSEDVAITGQGKIDGNNFVFLNFKKAKKIDTVYTRLTRQKENYRHVDNGIGDGPVVPNEIRPHQMVIFSNCKNIRLHGVSLVNSPFWTLHFADCDGVNVDGISIASGMLVPNADGIDVTSCSNVVITNSDIRSGDDAIAIVGYDHHFEIPGFSGLRHTSENIIVSNCNLQSYSSAIRIGFLDQNTVKNVQVSNVNITNSTRGIGIFVRDEGSLENIHFSNMYIETRLRTGDWWGNGEPIHISAVRGKKDVVLGTVKDVTFTDIACHSENGLLIWGSAESVIKGITLNHVTLQLVNSPSNKVAGGNIDLRGCLYEKDQLFAADIAAFKVNYIDGLSIEHCSVSWDSSMTEPYFTNALEVSHFNHLQLSDFTGVSSPSATRSNAVLLKEGENADIDFPKKQVTLEHVKSIVLDK